MRLVKVFVVSGALQTCFMPSSRMEVFERRIATSLQTYCVMHSFYFVS